MTQVTKEQFEANPRAKAIRDICLGIAKTIDYASESPTADLSDAYVSLERGNGQLIELGIFADMNTGFNAAKYNDPVTMAEYVAGQVVLSLGDTITPLKDVIDAPLLFSAFAKLRSVVNLTHRFFDAD